MASTIERTRLCRMLVVEDHPNELSLLLELLHGEGFEAIGCQTASEALELVKSGEVGVAILDLRLPDLSGTQLLELLRAKQESLRVIIYTGQGSYESAKEALNLGAFAYVEKAGDPGELLRQVHRALWNNIDRYAVELELAIAERGRAQRALQDAHDDLEVRVLERTSELNETNAALQREINVRRRAEEALREREALLVDALEDRETICQDLHDGVLQSLYAVGLGLESSKHLIQENSTEAASKVEQAISQLNVVMREVRRYISGLDPDILQSGDFKANVERLAAKLSSSGSADIRLDIDPTAAARLNRKEALHLLYIVQEALSNSLRHGGAKMSMISLARCGNGIRLDVRDDGIGFDTRAGRRAGYGLNNMTSRARKIGGDLQIASEAGHGARISLTLNG